MHLGPKIVEEWRGKRKEVELESEGGAGRLSDDTRAGAKQSERMKDSKRLEKERQMK